MDLAEYQLLAQKTALPTSLSREYLVPMIIGEIGELFGQKAKAVRDTWAPDDLAKMLISEYGDIAWGTAVLQRILGVWGEEGYQFPVHPDPYTALLQCSLRLHEADQNDDDTPWLDDAAEQLWYTLKHHCLAITGRDFDTVLSSNVDKLARRAQYDTIMGSGDLR